MRTLSLFALLSVVVALAACGTDDSPATTDFDGRTFLSQSATDGGRPKDLVAGTQVVLRFADGRLTASAGCNILGGTYSLDGDALRVGALSTTEMACDRELMVQDEWLAELLMSAPVVALDGDTLTISGATAGLVLLDREVADPDRPLVGTTWTVDTLLEGDTASSIPDGIAVELRFGEDGLVAISTGCNSGSAPYEVSGATIRFGDAALTLRACTGAQAAVESHVLAVLDGTAELEIEAGRLTITNGDVGLGLVAE